MTQPTPDEPQRDGSARVRRDPDRDLADHDLSDHDEALFHGPGRPWRHLRTIGLTLLLVLSLIHI